MNCKQTIFRIFAGSIAACALLFFASRLPAGFAPDDSILSVEIDGVNYGKLDNVAGLDQLQQNLVKSSSSKIVLHRDFVTDPSLYQWAKNLVSRHEGLKDIHIVTSSTDGRELSRSVLQLCQPLSWTIETASQGLGGFHETIEIAVQNIATY